MKKINVSVKQTNHPAIVKFEADCFLTNHRNYEFANIDEAKNAPLAQQLFYLPFVKTVYITGNFIAIEKYDIVAWEDVQHEVAQQIEAYLNSGQPVVAETGVSGKMPVTVYAESTPNPAAMKFVVNKKIVTAPFEFKNANEATDSPLAEALFNFAFVKEVFFDENYITVIKNDTADWDEIAGELRTFIREYIADEKTIVSAETLKAKTHSAGHTTARHEALDETSKEIIAILEEYVKPAVAGDGGNILFDSYDENAKTVKLILQGACSGCPSSVFTLKNGIENMLKSMLHDKVEEVIALNG